MRFTIKTNLALLATITLATHAFAIDNIPNASYAIYQDDKAPVTLKNVTFYTFDGNPIITVQYRLACRAYPKNKSLRLDPAAPKPQPVTYEIKPASKMHQLFGSGKGIIFFYDKHNNVIQQYECYKKGDYISITFPNPDVEPGRIGSLVELGGSNFERLKALIRLWEVFPLDLSRVTEKPRK